MMQSHLTRDDDEKRARGRSAGVLSCRMRATARSPATSGSAACTRRALTGGRSAADAASEAQIAPGRWDVDRVRCSDLLGAADEDREVAAMFYYGYLAAKAGIHVIDVNQIEGNVRR